MTPSDPATEMGAGSETRSACGQAPGTLGRRALFGGSLVIVEAAASAGNAEAQFSDMHHGANNPLPLSATETDNLLFPGFRQSFITTNGVEVEGKLASGAVINTLVGGNGPPLLLLHGFPENSCRLA